MEASVIIPAYNAARTLGQCLDAVLRQDYPRRGYEVIVVTDPSDDDTERIVRARRGVVHIKRTKREGVAVARNEGWSRARGDTVVFLDADCVPERGWLREMLRPVEKGADAVQGVYAGSKGTVVSRYAQYEIELRYRRFERKGINSLATYSAAIRRAALRDMGGFDPAQKEAEDAELSYRLTKKGYVIAFNPRARVAHRHPQTLHKYLSQKFRRGYWGASLYSKHPGNLGKDTYKPPSLLFEIALAGVIPLLFIGWTLRVMSPFPFATAVLALLLGTLPLALYSLQKDPLVGLASPMISVLRTYAILLGVSMGIVKRLLRI
ncbi:MAG: glycosyltransferase [Candidatus Aenigmatarchaeota archaeon]|nr:MAG: glycosyltransferase [Candidatus Aenigmarchaeota archaeon]